MFEDFILTCNVLDTSVQDPNVTQRCTDPAFLRMLNQLRIGKPRVRGGCGLTVAKICRRRKAWRGDVPTVEDIRRLFQRHKDTTILCITREKTALINELALQAKFPRREPLAILPGDIESNPENYDERHILKTNTAALKPIKLRVYQGMLVYFTRNVRKDVDFVNGMLAVVTGYDSASNSLQVVTKTGHPVRVWQWTDREFENKTYFPVRPGYASTIIKFQGAELSHVTVYLDVPGAPGAAYTALSRVATGKQYLIGGNVNPHHFTPNRSGVSDVKWIERVRKFGAKRKAK